jgi:hypothetical protein
MVIPGSKKLPIVLALIVFSGLILAFSSVQAQGSGSPLDFIAEYLEGILEQIRIIAEKDMGTNVTVEPNITVNPPEVNMHQNFTIEPEISLSQECNWENSVQTIAKNVGRCDNPVVFIFPEINWVDVNATKISYKVTAWRHSSPGPSTHVYLYLNGILVDDFGDLGKNYQIRELSNTDELEVGINKICYHDVDITEISIPEIYIEYEIKPANC